MISYVRFKEILDNIDSNREPEIELYFQNRPDTYMIIKYLDFISFHKCEIKSKQHCEMHFQSLDDLYNAILIDGIILKNEWHNINDIVFDGVFSIIDDKEDILSFYGIPK